MREWEGHRKLKQGETMKFTVTMKNPDCVSQAVEDALFYNPGKEEVIEVAINEWFEYNEYLEVEVDTDAGTCVVIKP